MKEVTNIQLQALLKELEQNPTNLDLINSLAITYFQNFEQKNDKEDYDYFEKAYKLKKTVKSTHNFAWFLYFEWSEIEWRWKQDNAIERALKIQKECIDLNPKSYYPYYQYGYMLLHQSKFEEAIPFLSKAYQIEAHRDVLHNIACCYFQMGEFQKARELFSELITDLDIENKSLYNLALTEWKLNNRKEVKLIANKLAKYIGTKFNNTINGYEIGLLYFLLDDLNRASDCLIKQGIDHIDLINCDYLSYALFNTHNELWTKKINERIAEQKKWSQEIENNHKDWAEYSYEEKNKQLNQLRAEIKIGQEILAKGVIKPSKDLCSKTILLEFCGCLLFDCKVHKNKKND